MVIKFNGDWKILQNMGNMHHVDVCCPEGKKYHEKMVQVHGMVMQALKDAQANGVDYVMFIHGPSSTTGSLIGTARSIVRAIMNSKEATPYIIKNRSIQHGSVFIAAIKPKINR